MNPKISLIELEETWARRISDKWCHPHPADNGKRRRKGAKSTDLVLDESSEREIVEQIGEVPPYVGVSVLPQALVVEAVDLGDLTRFVVSSEDSNPIAVPQLHRDEESNGLDGVVSSVYIITHEEVVGIG